jgi:ketosteroid isomerase-like protein
VSEHSNAALHRQMLEDPDAPEELIAEDAVFRYSALGRLSGEYRGRDAILELFEKVVTRPGGPPQRQNEAFLGGKDVSVCLARFQGQVDGRAADIGVAEVFRWRNGQVVERWAYFGVGPEAGITV